MFPVIRKDLLAIELKRTPPLARWWIRSQNPARSPVKQRSKQTRCGEKVQNSSGNFCLNFPCNEKRFCDQLHKVRGPYVSEATSLIYLQARLPKDCLHK